MLNEEPAQSQDLQMMGMLLPLGIEKGKDFKPEVAPRKTDGHSSRKTDQHLLCIGECP
jgi:hypothetical protein